MTARRGLPISGLHRRPLGQAIDRIVIHITDAPTTSSTVNHFTRADANSSAHYLVGQDGEVDPVRVRSRHRLARKGRQPPQHRHRACRGEAGRRDLRRRPPSPTCRRQTRNIASRRPWSRIFAGNTVSRPIARRSSAIARRTPAPLMAPAPTAHGTGIISWTWCPTAIARRNRPPRKGMPSHWAPATRSSRSGIAPSSPLRRSRDRCPTTISVRSLPARISAATIADSATTRAPAAAKSPRRSSLAPMARSPISRPSTGTGASPRPMIRATPTMSRASPTGGWIGTPASSRAGGGRCRPMTTI